jgi:hypothetical protein
VMLCAYSMDACGRNRVQEPPRARNSLTLRQTKRVVGRPITDLQANFDRQT